MKYRIPFRQVLLYAYFPILMLNFYLVMYGVNTYSFILLPCLLLLIWFSISIIASDLSSRKNALFTIFLLYNILSIVHYAYNGRPLDCYTTALRYVVFPMTFYIFGQDERDDSNKLYHYLLYSCIFLFVVGWYLYFVGPDYYKSFLMNARENKWYTGSFSYGESDVLQYARMSSFFTSSYEVSYFSIPCLIISLMLVLNKNEYLKKWLLYVFAVICWVSSILCMQRVAIASGTLFLLFYLYYTRKEGNNKSGFFLLFIIICVIAVAISAIATDRGAVIYEMLTGRIDDLSFSTAMSERSGVTDKALRAWNYYIFGGGIGSFSTVAIQHGFPGVADAEYVRILTEYGAVGAFIFGLLVLKNLYHGVKYFRVYKIEVCIIAFFLIAFLGSNSLSMTFTFSPVFWYALGHIRNTSYMNRFIKENINYTIR